VDKPVNKAQLLHHLQSLLQEKVTAAQQEIISTRDPFTSDSKSSAGDKHEVGRSRSSIAWRMASVSCSAV
jgi:hypothetical protein